jgi:hypothetical protein
MSIRVPNNAAQKVPLIVACYTPIIENGKVTIKLYKNI